MHSQHFPTPHSRTPSFRRADRRPATAAAALARSGSGATIVPEGPAGARTTGTGRSCRVGAPALVAAVLLGTFVAAGQAHADEAPDVHDVSVCVMDTIEVSTDEEVVSSGTSCGNPATSPTGTTSAAFGQTSLIREPGQPPRVPSVRDVPTFSSPLFSVSSSSDEDGFDEIGIYNVFPKENVYDIEGFGFVVKPIPFVIDPATGIKIRQPIMIIADFTARVIFTITFSDGRIGQYTRTHTFRIVKTYHPDYGFGAPIVEWVK